MDDLLAEIRLRAARQERVLATLPMIQKWCKKYKVPVPIALAVLDVESHGWPHATSPVGAMGYMQLMPKTAKGNRLGSTVAANKL